MADFATYAQLDKLENENRKKDEKLAKIKQKGEEILKEGITMLEIGGTALAFGYANTKYGTNGEYALFGVPVDIAFALVAHGLAWGGMAGKYAEHAHQVANGALASYLVRLGGHLATAATTTTTPAVPATSGVGALPYGARRGATTRHFVERSMR